MPPFPHTHRQRRSIRTCILTSDRNRQNSHEYGRILSLKDKGIRTVAFRDWAKGGLIVTTCFQWRSKEEGNQVNLKKIIRGSYTWRRLHLLLLTTSQPSILTVTNRKQAWRGLLGKIDRAISDFLPHLFFIEYPLSHFDANCLHSMWQGSIIGG
jgi:hypothetical protein